MQWWPRPDADGPVEVFGRQIRMSADGAEAFYPSMGAAYEQGWCRLKPGDYIVINLTLGGDPFVMRRAMFEKLYEDIGG